MTTYKATTDRQIRLVRQALDALRILQTEEDFKDAPWVMTYIVTFDALIWNPKGVTSTGSPAKR